METMLVRERYKVVRVLWSETDYALAEAVDIQDRETPACLLNFFEGEQMARYGRLCSAVRQEDCPALRGLFLENDTLVAVFDPCSGEEIDRVFHRGDRWEWRDRLDFAQLVLHQALSMANLPPEISCAAMLSDNLRIDVEKRRVSVRYMLRPAPEVGPRELPLLAGDQVCKILLGRLNSPDEEAAFLARLRRGEFPTIVALYAAWRDILPGLQEQYEIYESKNFFARGITQVKRWFSRRKKKRRNPG